MWEPAAAISAPSPTAPELIDQVLNRLGNAMAINRLIIAEGKDSTAVAAASDALAEQNESYRRTKRQRAKAGCDGWQRN